MKFGQSRHDRSGRGFFSFLLSAFGGTPVVPGDVGDGAAGALTHGGVGGLGGTVIGPPPTGGCGDAGGGTGAGGGPAGATGAAVAAPVAAAGTARLMPGDGNSSRTPLSKPV